jgi:hypothetical protein
MKFFFFKRRVEAGVVHENVDAAIGFQRSRGHRLSFLRRGDVDGHGDSVAAGRFDVGGNFLRFHFLNIGDDDLGAFFGESVRVSFADAHAAAGDNRYSVF